MRNLKNEISIHQAKDIADYRDCEQIQREAWGAPEAEIVPLHILRPISEKGGLVINARDKTGRPVGTNISILGKHGGKTILYSHMTGVIPEYQSKGVGLALKLKQRQYAIENGFDLVCWTFDPMQSLNSWFNFGKLAVLSRTYYVNYYGEMPDNVNRGLETDRFLAEWWVRSLRVESRIQSQEAHTSENVNHSKIVNPTILADGVHRPDRARLDLADEVLFVEIPHSYDSLRNTPLLLLWREVTRQVYTHYFSLGYIATESIVIKSQDPRSFVKMERRSLERILQS